jgi:hypothetical protein
VQHPGRRDRNLLRPVPRSAERSARLRGLRHYLPGRTDLPQWGLSGRGGAVRQRARLRVLRRRSGVLPGRWMHGSRRRPRKLRRLRLRLRRRTVLRRRRLLLTAPAPSRRWQPGVQRR